MSGAERVYRALLRLYPSSVRDEYAHEMLRTFRDARRDRCTSEWRFWCDIALDIARSTFSTLVLNAMAILAAFVGVIVAGSVVVELSAGGVGDRDAVSLVALTLFAIVGLLTVATGVALWRRGRDATAFTRRIAAVCLVVFAIASAQQPILSMFARSLGIAFPALLLLVLSRRQHTLAI